MNTTNQADEISTFLKFSYPFFDLFKISGIYCLYYVVVTILSLILTVNKKMLNSNMYFENIYEQNKCISSMMKNENCSLNVSKLRREEKIKEFNGRFYANYCHYTNELKEKLTEFVDRRIQEERQKSCAYFMLRTRKIEFLLEKILRKQCRDREYINYIFTERNNCVKRLISACLKEEINHLKREGYGLKIILPNNWVKIWI
jgi:hypothetical protein